MFSESTAVPYYCPVIHVHCTADARFVSARDVIHDTIENLTWTRKLSSICDVAARTRELLSIHSSIVSQMSING